MSELEENNIAEFKNRRKEFLDNFRKYTLKYGFEKYNMSSVVKEFDDLYIILNMQKSAYSSSYYFNVIFLFKELMDSDFKSYFKKWSTGHLDFRVESYQGGYIGADKNCTHSKLRFYDLELVDIHDLQNKMKQDVDYIQPLLNDALSSKEKINQNVMLSDKYKLPRTYWLYKWFGWQLPS